MKKLDEAKNLFDNAKKIRGFIVSFKEKIKESSIDKKSLNFKKGRSDRFVSVDLPMYLECYTGYYGNSGCSTERLTNIQQEVQEAYVEWCNENMQMILDGIADKLESKAHQTKEKVKKELELAQLEYEQFFGEAMEYLKSN